MTDHNNKSASSDSWRAKFDALFGEMVVGGATGAATGEAAGAALGAATPLAVRGLAWGAREFRERVLGQREALRVINAITVAKARIDERLAAGDVPRSDGFFNAGEANRSDAEELLEGVLLAAQREYEERKVSCYGNLYANIAFEPAIDSVTANSLLREADDLSYTQIQLLALVARKDVIPLPRAKLGTGGRVAWRTASIRNALDDIGFTGRRLVAVKRGPIDVLPALVGIPADLELTPRGELLYALMQPDQLSTDELRPLAEALWESAGSQPPWSVDEYVGG
jgi:hypothetical protein